jgi:hypothetical protein
MVPPLSDPASRIKSFPALEEGEHGQCHDDAPREETTPADSAVVSFKQGFCPGTSISPEIHGKGAILSHPWLHH